MRAIWTAQVVVLAALSDDASQLRQHAEPKNAANPKAVEVTANGALVIPAPPRSLLEAFNKRHQLIHAANENGTEGKPKAKPNKREATEGLPIQSLFGDSDLSGLFNGTLMTDLLNEPFEMPWGNATPETDTNDTYVGSGWNGMYHDADLSPSQILRAGEGGGREAQDIVRVAEVLAKNLIDLGDEDYSQYYVAQAVPSVNIPGPLKHYLKKKEVVKIVAWVVRRLDIMRTQLVNHFAAIDPMLFKLAGYFDDASRVEKIMDDNMANFLENFASLSEHTRKMVNARVENSKSILPTKTDKAWIQSLDKDIRKFNSSSLQESTKVYDEIQDKKNDMYTDFNNIKDSYHRFDSGTEDQLALWQRTYSTLMKGVMGRLHQKALLMPEDLGNMLHHFRLEEQRQQLEWFKSFLSSFRGIQAKSSFLNVATGLESKTISKFRNSLADTKDKWDERIGKYFNTQKQLIGMFQESVTGFKSSISRTSRSRITNMGRDLKDRIDTTWKVLKAKGEMSIAELAKKADEEANGKEVAKLFIDTNMGFKKNISSLKVGLSSVPSTVWIRRGIQRWGEIDDEFRDTLKRDVFQPVLTKMSSSIKSARGAWKSKMRESTALQRSAANRMAENITAESNMMVNDIISAQKEALRAANDVNDREEEVQTRATSIAIPTLDSLWSTLRSVQGALLELTTQSASLHTQVAALNQTKSTLQGREDADRVRAAAKGTIDDWHSVVQQSTQSLVQKLSEVAHLTPPRFEVNNSGFSLVEVTPSTHLMSMLEKLSAASDMIKQLPNSLTAAVKNETDVVSSQMKLGVKQASDQYLANVRAILDMDPLPAELQAAESWVKKARFRINGTVPELSLDADVQRLRDAYDAQERREDAAQERVNSALDHAHDGDVLVEQTFERKRTLAQHTMNQLAANVHAWADALPNVRPLEDRITAQDVQIPPPRAELPSLEDLGLERQPLQELQTDLQDAKHQATLAHEKAVSALLEQAEAAHVLTSADVVSDAGEILLADALDDGRLAQFPPPQRDKATKEAQEFLHNTMVAAVEALPRAIDPRMPSVNPVPLPDTLAVERAVDQLRKTGNAASVATAAAKSEQDLDKAEQFLQSLIHGGIEAELAAVAAQPALKAPMLDTLKKQSDQVEHALQLRMNNMWGGAMHELDMLIDKMSASKTSVDAALAKQGGTVEHKMEELSKRSGALQAELADVDNKTKADSVLDEDLHASFEKELDALPPVGAEAAFVERTPAHASALPEVSRLQEESAARAASDQTREEHVSKLEAALSAVPPMHS